MWIDFIDLNLFCVMSRLIAKVTWSWVVEGSDVKDEGVDEDW